MTLMHISLKVFLHPFTEFNKIFIFCKLVTKFFSFNNHCNRTFHINLVMCII